MDKEVMHCARCYVKYVERTMFGKYRSFKILRQVYVEAYNNYLNIKLNNPNQFKREQASPIMHGKNYDVYY